MISILSVLFASTRSLFKADCLTSRRFSICAANRRQSVSGWQRVSLSRAKTLVISGYLLGESGLIRRSVGLGA